MKRGIRQAIVSAAVFMIVLLAIVSADSQVRERFTDLASGTTNTAALTDQSATIVDAVTGAVKHQSIENAPLLVFATAGVVLFLFMVRT